MRLSLLLHFMVSATLCVALPQCCMGMIVAVDGQNPNAPFAFTFTQNGGLTFDLTLQAFNESAEPGTMLGWLTALQIHPAIGSHGTLEFQAVSAPPDSMFGLIPGPLSDLMPPSDHLTASDADTGAFTGVTFAPGDLHNMVQLSLGASSNAAGTFELITQTYDPMMQDFGASWFPADAEEPVAFGNSAPSSLPGFILLGTVVIVSPVIGDYTGDGIVDGSDYSKWRQEFNSPALPPGSGADGNANGVVDAADYVVWRNQVAGTPLGAAVVPEPSAAVITLLLLFFLPQLRGSIAGRPFHGVSRGFQRVF